MAAIATTGCRTTIDTENLEEQIAQGLKAQTGVTAESVNCPEDVEAEAGATFECTAEAEGGGMATITVTQVDDKGNVRWELTSTG